ncbi:hypothetical protein C8J57DRAFT_1225290 [Mycena rebaudengoi]|nr:hypothetical protein C8J57DRAFT_1225290 [Mycena rebaudengoi]
MAIRSNNIILKNRYHCLQDFSSAFPINRHLRGSVLPSADMLSTSSFNAYGTLGAMQVGVMISYVMFGVSTTQTYIFYTRFVQDCLKLKLLVAFVWFWHSLYAMTITDYGHAERLVRVPQSFVAAFIFSGLIGSSSSVVGAVFAFSMQSVATYEARFRWLLVTVWIASVVNDLAIALTLVYLLYRARVTVHERTVALLDKLIAWNIVSNNAGHLLNSRESLRAMDEAVTISYSFDRAPLHFISKSTQAAFQKDP